MPNITTCTQCGKCYEESSEEQANVSTRLCRACTTQYNGRDGNGYQPLPPDPGRPASPPKEYGAEALRLKQAVEDWHDRAVTAERHLESLQNRYAQATAEAEAYRAELERLRDVVSEIDASLIDDVLGA